MFGNSLHGSTISKTKWQEPSQIEIIDCLILRRKPGKMSLFLKFLALTMQLQIQDQQQILMKA